jgi:hypothetical protein
LVRRFKAGSKFAGTRSRAAIEQSL